MRYSNAYFNPRLETDSAHATDSERSAYAASTRPALKPIDSEHCIKGMVPVPKNEWARIHRNLRNLLPFDLSLGLKLLDVRSRYLPCYNGWRGYGFKVDCGDKTKILIAMMAGDGEIMPLDGSDSALAAVNQRAQLCLSRSDVVIYAAHYFRSVERSGDYSSPCLALDEWPAAEHLSSRDRQRLGKMVFGLNFASEDFGAWRLQGIFAGGEKLYARDFLVDPRGEIFMLGEEILATVPLEARKAPPIVRKDGSEALG